MRGQKKTTMKPLVKRVAKLEREVNEREVKYTLQPLNAATVVRFDNVGSPTAICFPPPQGLGAENRIGDSIQPTKVEFSMGVAINTAAASSFSRVLIIQYKNLTPPTLALSNIMEGTGGATAPHGTFRIQDRNDFTVLYDKKFWLNTSTTGEAVNKLIEVDLYPKHKIVFNIGASTYAQGQIVAYFISDWAPADAQRPTGVGYCKLRYTDA